MFTSIFNGKPKYEEHKTKYDYRKKLIKPSNRFRIIIQKKPTTGNNYEECKSIMVYDFTGKLSTVGLIRKIQKGLK